MKKNKMEQTLTGRFSDGVMGGRQSTALKKVERQIFWESETWARPEESRSIQVYVKEENFSDRGGKSIRKSVIANITGRLKGHTGSQDDNRAES